MKTNFIQSCIVITDPHKQRKRFKVNTIVKTIKPPLILSIHIYSSRNELVLKMLPQTVHISKYPSHIINKDHIKQRTDITHYTIVNTVKPPPLIQPLQLNIYISVPIFNISPQPVLGKKHPGKKNTRGN